MAATDNEVPAPIIVKKIKKGGGGHHGGAWKVAYADFVTAMMAFFLLMWLLNVTTEEQKNAISNYFDPTHPRVSNDFSGSGGILGGMTMSSEGAQVSRVQDIAVPPTRQPQNTQMAQSSQNTDTGQSDYTGDTYDPELEGRVPSDTDLAAREVGENNLQEGMNILDEMQKITEADLEQMKAIAEQAQNADFEAIKQKIEEEISKSPELQDLMENLMIDITPEGLRIQIIDSEGRSMFPIGKADMYPFMQQLVSKVTQVIMPQPNQISVRGHTDGKPYPAGAKYNNWNLSSDRALASQRAMEVSGLPRERVENVVGKADREHLLPDEPLSPRNRRISIILLREKLETSDQIQRAAAEAVKRAQDRAREQREQQEDRENAPQYERVIEGSTVFTIEGADVPEAQPRTRDDNNVDVGREIQEIRDQAERRNQTPPRVITLPAPDNAGTGGGSSGGTAEPQILEFP